jgi:hypothetical protein
MILTSLFRLLANAVDAVEGDSISALGVIKRSWDLTAGAYCDIFCSHVLMIITIMGVV